MWKSQGDLPPISIPQTNWLQTPSIVQIKKGKWTVFNIKVPQYLPLCRYVNFIKLMFFFLFADHYRALGRVIHAANLKEQLKHQKKLNLDATRADIKLVEQLEVLADTLYIKVTDLIPS